MKNLNEFYEAMRHLSRNESQIQEAWEEWNKVKWETAFDYDELKEGDCVIFPDFTISFVENGQGIEIFESRYYKASITFTGKDWQKISHAIQEGYVELQEEVLTLGEYYS
jgi:hypothetical protein